MSLNPAKQCHYLAVMAVSPRGAVGGDTVKVNANNVLDALHPLVMKHDKSEFILFDNGPEFVTAHFSDEAKRGRYPAAANVSTQPMTDMCSSIMPDQPGAQSPWCLRVHNRHMSGPYRGGGTFLFSNKNITKKMH